jgi:molybdopterin-biosynthesis enzyme MoeA-like protein
LTESTDRPTAAILLTGNELLRGVISDLTLKRGSWLRVPS